MSFFYCEIYKHTKEKFSTWMKDQLNRRLQGKHPDQSHHKIINWTELLKWCESSQGAVEDETSWKCRQGPFDGKKNDGVSKKFKIDYGTQRVCEKKKDCVECVVTFSKRMLQKSIQNNRGKEHGKRINKTTKNNRAPKRITPMKTKHSNGKR